MCLAQPLYLMRMVSLHFFLQQWCASIATTPHISWENISFFLQAVAQQLLLWINCKMRGGTDAAHNLVCLLLFFQCQVSLNCPTCCVVRRTLHNNFFNGTIHESFGNLALLKYLTMQNNHIQGSLPASLGNLTELRLLYVLEISCVKPFLVTNACADLLDAID